MAAKSSQNKAEKTARQGRAQSITEVLGNVLEPVLARKTGMKLDLVKAWQELAGPDYAFTTRPEKIDWPRKRNEEDLFEPGVLVVACEPSAALFFQHDQKHIIERVNVFFGFEAIKRIKILQKPVLTTQATDGSKTTKPLSPQDQERLQNLLKDIDDPELRNRLLQLGKGVFAAD